MGAIVSRRLPGRIRVAIDEIRSQAIVAYRLECKLMHTSGVVGAECNPHTGRALVCFDETVISTEQIVHLIDSVVATVAAPEKHEEQKEVAATVESHLRPSNVEPVAPTSKVSIANPYLVPSIASSSLLGVLSLKRMLVGRSVLAVSPLTFWAGAGVSLIAGYPALRRGVETLVKERKLSPDLWMGLATLSMAAIRENLVALAVITAVNASMYRRYKVLQCPEDTALGPELERHSQGMSRLSLWLAPITLLLTRSPMRAVGVALAANPRPAILSHKYRFARAEQEAAERGLIGTQSSRLSLMAGAKSIVFADENVLTGSQHEWVVRPIQENVEITKAIAIAASLLQKCDTHPWRRDLIERAKQEGRTLHTPFEVQQASIGIKGIVQGQHLLFGTKSFLTAHGIGDTEFLLDERRMRRQGYNPEILVVEGRPIALFGCRSCIDENWQTTIRGWREHGIQVRALKTDRFHATVLDCVSSDELYKDLQSGTCTILVGGESSLFHKELVHVASRDAKQLPELLKFCQEQQGHSERDVRILRVWNFLGVALALMSPPLAPLVALSGDVAAMFLIAAQHWPLSLTWKRIKAPFRKRTEELVEVGRNERPDRNPIHTPSVEELLARFGTATSGLSSAQILERQQQWGANKLVTPRPPSALHLFGRQFRELSTMILLGTAGLSFVMGERFSAVCMLGILALNALIGVWQEKRSNAVIESLKVDDEAQAKVRREGIEQLVAVQNLVPGDVVLLEPGDRVPADIRIVESWNLEANEAMLTGESTSVTKFDTTLERDTPLAERSNTLFMGTVVTRGRCTGIVVATGSNTEIGQVGELINLQGDAPTFLQTKVAEVSKRFVIGAVVAAVLVAGVGLVRGIPPVQLLISCVTLAASAIPEGLPITITVALTAGVLQMSKRHAVIKKLANLESLGRVTVICSDKTGTLTKNEMTVKELVTVGDRILVSGDGYSTEGGFSSFSQPNVPISVKDHEDATRLLTVGMLCNNAHMEVHGNTDPVGDPTETALLIAAMKAHIDPNSWRRHREIPFDSTSRSMSVVCEEDQQSTVVCDGRTPLRKCTLFSKGAPETVVDKCSHYVLGGQVFEMTDDVRHNIRRENQRLAEQALRVLAFAYKDLTDDEDPLHVDDAHMVYVGLMAMMDPPKDGVIDSITEARKLGITSVMMTGDHPWTARAIGSMIGLFNNGDRILTGRDIEVMSGTQLESEVGTTTIFARVSPEHKLRIVEAFQRRGEVVAMTGDGVNDAPAIRKADVGIAMGRKGTDITKGTAGIVLMEDHFHAIVDGVTRGRSIIGNIRKAMGCLLSGNLAEVFVTALSVVLGLPIPLIPLQILLMNILTDAVPAMVLATGKAAPVVNQPYKDVIDKELYQNVVVRGVVLGMGAVGVFAAGLWSGMALPLAQTMAYASLVVGQLWQTLAWRNYGSHGKSYLKNDRVLLTATVGSFAALAATIYVPGLRTVFATSPLGVSQWGTVLAVTGGLTWFSQRLINKLTGVSSVRHGTHVILGTQVESQVLN